MKNLLLILFTCLIADACKSQTSDSTAIVHNLLIGTWQDVNDSDHYFVISKKRISEKLLAMTTGRLVGGKGPRYYSYIITAPNYFYVFAGSPSKKDTFCTMHLYYVNRDSLKFSRVGGSPAYEIYRRVIGLPK